MSVRINTEIDSDIYWQSLKSDRMKSVQEKGKGGRERNSKCVWVGDC